MSQLSDDEEKTPDGSVMDISGEEFLAGVDPSVPVGITIAYKRQISGFHESMIARETPPRRRYDASSTPVSSDSTTKSTLYRYRSNRSIQVFLECAFLYGICTTLPTIVGFLYDWYVVWKYQRDTGTTVVMEDDSSFLSYYMGKMIPFNYQSWCEEEDTASSSWTSYFLSQTGFCSSFFSNSSEERPIISQDVTAWSDSFTISVFAFFLATIRIAIVQAAVPSDDENALEAMFRCKSAHLLSSDYVVTPVATPRQSVRPVISTLLPSNAEVTIPFPDLQSVPNSSLPNMTTTTTTTDTFSAEPISAHSLGIGVPRRSSAAPRYATALFRLLYSAVAAGMALVLFRGANFWPWFVGGHGQTEQCWDLSGGLAVGMDSDFDQRNVALKQYFLWQASYHYHSGVFHVLSMLTLLLHSSKHAPHRFLRIEKGTPSAYVRRLLQHVMAVALIGIAYLFSSLRRLCAVGLFAFDVSSLFLHLLQVCINAPEQSRWRGGNRNVSTVFRWLVIPSFVFTRFYIWPTLWYSATFESTPWLLQLEKTLWPGSAALLRTAIHVLMGMIEILSVVYFRRLLDHPHLKRVLDRERNDDIARRLFADSPNKRE